MKWFQTIYGVNFSLGCLDVVFGIVSLNNDEILKTLNFCILFGKYFIRKNKLQGKNVDLPGFLDALRQRLETEKYILTSKEPCNQFNTKWGLLYNRLVNLQANV